jgi:hypothetical protein
LARSLEVRAQAPPSVALPHTVKGATHSSVHWPLRQRWPAPQTTPHCPQFSESDIVAAQYGVPVWVQRVVPPVQTLVQLPLLQNSPDGHTVPHAPQFCWSERRSAQPDGHDDRGAAQVTVH